MYATISWNAVTTNADGTPITDLAGYYIYHGYTTLNYTEVPIFVVAPTTQYIFTDLPLGVTNYFNVKAADLTGNLSTFGGEVSIRNEFPILVIQGRLDIPRTPMQWIWHEDTSDQASGFMADAAGANVIVLPPSPPSYPIYETLGGFMIV